MRQIIMFALLLAASWAITAGQTPGLRADSERLADEEAIRQLEYKMVDQLLQGDPAYAANLADDYVLISSDASVHGKAEMVARIIARDPAQRMESMSPSNLKIRVYGDTAVLNFELTFVSLVNGQRVSGHGRATKVFIKRDARWYMVNNQGTPLPASAGK